MTGRRGAPALATGAAVAWSNAVLPRLASRYGWTRDARSAATLAFCAADAALARTRVPTAAGVAAGGALAGAGLALVRPVQREAPSNRATWMLVDIPLGTALPEEMLFRGSLTPTLQAAYGRRVGAVASPLAFGLWHVGAARSAHDPVFPTIGVTAGFGALMDALARRTGRWWPCFLAHWMLNAGGVILSSGSVISSPEPLDP
ncbi:CPBP family intramembrane glutamic endopeptidase [Tsukamurella paurometabola]|uniref:CAAX amino terminal protease self- immunity n=1 Tax=Tsukamurella paurometabola TaxID=2061 RepID=A0A3P8MER9_TSUPA|nr:CPBP family intramembrane glutamic endopeptidase [Tsukamurella paurometabola]MBS4100698.1 CPBP family intramembrane metalloprotease [Tsukamurella paurometabola]UEA83566.1 CPBP family intramembrane metalloprotease [Tsukamurella paurometabola]VDR40693.1 CAAX amino terminal protease self- immunity [Tsukamurella paurometabola]